MSDASLVKVSPRHSVSVDEDYLALIERAPRQDYVVRTLARKMVGNSPIMTGELVIAGGETREQFALAQVYPLHFRKTYYTGRLRGDPSREFECHTRASRLVDVPAPIGHSLGVFRSCLLPGKPYKQLSPFGSEPENSNIRVASELHFVEAVGLWRIIEDLFNILQTLQRGGLTHGDAELHNFIVCPTPLETLPIDFELAVVEEEVSPEEWESRSAADLSLLLKEAIYLQCALGEQSGPLADLAFHRLDELFQSGAQFRRAIDRRSNSTA